MLSAYFTLVKKQLCSGAQWGQAPSRNPGLCQRPPPGAGTRPVSTCFLGTHHEPSSGTGPGVREVGLVRDAEGSVAWPGGRSWALGVLSLGPGLSEDLECVMRTVGTTVYLGLGTRHQRRSEPGFREHLPPPTLPHHHSSPSAAGQHQGGAGSQGAGWVGSSGWVSWGGAGGGGVGRSKRRWGQCGPADAARQGGALHGAGAWCPDGEGRLRRRAPAPVALAGGGLIVIPLPPWLSPGPAGDEASREPRCVRFVAGRRGGPTCGPVFFVRQEGRSGHGAGGTVDAGGLRREEVCSCSPGHGRSLAAVRAH